VRFERNDYSVPHTHTRKTLLVVADLMEVRVMEGGECIAACPPRSYDQRQQIENPKHIEALIQRKRQAREHRGKDRLAHACPSSRTLLEQAAQRGDNLGSMVSTLLRILDQYGTTETEQAIIESLSRGVSQQLSATKTGQ
jgi:hypothetical protein